MQYPQSPSLDPTTLALSKSTRWNHQKSALNQEQLAAIHRYAAKNGRYWKSRLIMAWSTGADEREIDAALLRQVRNDCGPLWLKRFVLPQEAA